LINATHSAYYFYNQGWAHVRIRDALRNDGILSVTLVSENCVLNKITRFLLSAYGQTPLTAERYLAMITKIGGFDIDSLKTFRSTMNVDIYLRNEENIKGLAYILARNRLPESLIDSSLPSLAKYLDEHCRNLPRINKIMFFKKSEFTADYKDSENDFSTGLHEVELSKTLLEIIKNPRTLSIITGDNSAVSIAGSNATVIREKSDNLEVILRGIREILSDIKLSPILKEKATYGLDTIQRTGVENVGVGEMVEAATNIAKAVETDLDSKKKYSEFINGLSSSLTSSAIVEILKAAVGMIM